MMPIPARPSTPTDRTIFYHLPAGLLAKGMTTNDGFDIDSVRIDAGVVSYLVVVDIDCGGGDVCEERSAAAGDLVHLSVFWDTDVDGSVLPEAVDVRTR
jgi:hypothetical protein